MAPIGWIQNLGSSLEIIAGVDEAGRGPLAGPVVASAVILPENHGIEGLADSKKLTAKKREKLFDEKNNEIGELRSGAYSPHFEKVIGIAMIFKPYWNISQPFKIKINGKTFDGKICDLPFI